MKSTTRLVLCHIVLLISIVGAVAQPPETTPFEQTSKVLKVIRASKMSPDEAWEKGILTKPVLIYAVGEETLLDPERGLWNPGPETYGYTALLLKKVPEILDIPYPNLTVPMKVRVAQTLSGQYFQRRYQDEADADVKPDARVEALYLESLKEMPRDGLFVQVSAIIYNLSGYYQRIGQPRKAADIALKSLEYKASPEDYSNLVLSAARAYRSMGDDKRADELYQQVIGYGYGWTIGHARSDLARNLMNQGKVEEARTLLKQPVPGRLGEQSRIMLLSQLARSYFETGEWEQARRYARECIADWKAIAEPVQNHGLEYIPKGAEYLLQEIDEWSKAPMKVTRPSIELRAGKPGESILTFVTVSSYRGLELTATTDNPLVKVRPMQGPSGPGQQYLLVEVSAELAPARTTVQPAVGHPLGRPGKTVATLTITSPLFPDVKLQVPVRFEQTAPLAAPG